jgi:hypothetical protein
MTCKRDLTPILNHLAIASGATLELGAVRGRFSSRLLQRTSYGRRDLIIQTNKRFDPIIVLHELGHVLGHVSGCDMGITAHWGNPKLCSDLELRDIYSEEIAAWLVAVRLMRYLSIPFTEKDRGIIRFALSTYRSHFKVKTIVHDVRHNVNQRLRALRSRLVRADINPEVPNAQQTV